MKVTAILKGRKDADGKQKIYIRINEGSKRTYKATNVRVRKTEFKKGRIVDHPQALALNQSLKKQIVETEAALVRQDMIVYKDGEFFDYAEKLFCTWDKVKSINTMETYRIHAKMFREYAGSELKLSRLSQTLLEDYRDHMIGEGYQPHSVKDRIGVIYRVCKRAVRDKLIKENPAEGLPLPTIGESIPKFLLEDQVELIDQYRKRSDIKENKRMVATWFVIGCYTGFRISDMKQFDRKTHIRHNRLVMRTTKTTAVVGMPVSDKIKELFEYIDYQPIEYSTCTFDFLIKEIADVVGIKDNIHAHVARHTFATLALTKGVRIEVVQKIMGHKSLRTTERYAKVVNQLIDQEMIKMQQ